MRTVGVVTVGRSDYGIYLPVLQAIRADEDLDLRLIVAGMHLSPEFGSTAQTVEADGYEIAEKVEMLLSSDTPEGVAKSIGLGVIGFAQVFGRFRPDILVVLGDRFEMFAAALAALPFKIPVAHIHGGELTEGAIDDALRHAITKLSHLHFVATEEYAKRVIQIGEQPWRVVVSGAPSLDNLCSTKFLNAAELEATFGLDLGRPPLLVTFHPVTLEYEQTEWQVGELLVALDACDIPVVFTKSNADTHGRMIEPMIRQFCERHPSARVIDNMGTQGYFSLMALAAAMVGNSSSGIIEAPSFKLPVVNIGTRQNGRVRASNVFDVGYGRAEIADGIKKAAQPTAREDLRELANPYLSTTGAAQTIVAHLKETELGEGLVIKRFFDVPSSVPAGALV